MPPPRKPPEDRLDELEADLQREDHWERPTQQRIKRIEESGPPATYPPASSVGKRWTPAGVVLVLTAFGAMCVTAGGALGPIFMKPDLTGYVKEERLNACEAKLDARQEANEKWREEERGRTARCYDKLGACQSQQGANAVVIESMDPKKRRRP